MSDIAREWTAELQRDISMISDGVKVMIEYAEACEALREAIRIGRGIEDAFDGREIALDTLFLWLDQFFAGAEQRANLN